MPSVAHYLTVDPAKPLILHHARGGGDMILTHIVTQGMIELDPPGLAMALANVYSG